MLTMEKKLEEVGFYTLSNERAMNASIDSALWRCELILLDGCTFKCPYCRGLRSDCSGTVPFDEASRCLALWIDEGLKNIRFSGGEPTLYEGLLELVKQAQAGGIERIAISTNGYADTEFYLELVEAGVNDISISLDACCAAVGEAMSGGVKGSWDKVVRNIEILSSKTYVTVGMVFDEKNVGECMSAVQYADSLGVSDVRVIPSAQYDEALAALMDLSEEVLDKYPILRYRMENLEKGVHVRGIEEGDSHTCWLAMDDMAVAGGDKGLKHFPCIIHLREGGDPVGNVGPDMRQERADWLAEHDPFEDPICLANCLDVCTHYNRVADSVR